MQRRSISSGTPTNGVDLLAEIQAPPSACPRAVSPVQFPLPPFSCLYTQILPREVNASRRKRWAQQTDDDHLAASSNQLVPEDAGDVCGIVIGLNLIMLSISIDKIRPLLVAGGFHQKTLAVQGLQKLAHL